jgi:hypothetical protein
MKNKAKIAITVVCLVILFGWIISITLISSRTGMFLGVTFLTSLTVFAVIFFVVSRKTGWVDKAEEVSEPPVKAIISVNHAEMQEAMAKSKAVGKPSEILVETLYPDVEWCESREIISQPGWLPDELKKHW